jgi:hypothetical protein
MVENRALINNIFKKSSQIKNQLGYRIILFLSVKADI